MPESTGPESKDYMTPESERERRAEINRIADELLKKAKEKLSQPDGSTAEGGMFTVDGMLLVMQCNPEDRFPLDCLALDFVGDDEDSAIYRMRHHIDDAFTIDKKEFGKSNEAVLPAEANWVLEALGRAEKK